MKYYEVNFTICAQKMLMQDVRDVLSAMAGEAGFETFEETEEGLKGYVQQGLFDATALDELIAAFPFDGVRISYTVNEAENRDWNEQWEQEGFDPIVIGNRCIIHDGRHFGNETPEAYEIAIEIDAHQAFGTGTHETTRMMVKSLLELPLQGKQVLDCGCGTGILGIAALKGGATRCVGYDIDEWSADNARHNAVINQVDDRFTSLLGDASLLHSMHDSFDVVLANINRNILLADMPAFKEKMAQGAILLLSGFYTADTPLLVEKAATLGLSLTGQKQEGDWACLMFK